MVSLWVDTLRPHRNGSHITVDISDAFHDRKSMEFDRYFAEVCSQESSLKYVSIGSGNHLSQIRRQAIN